jgi:hypothetical protein
MSNGVDAAVNAMKSPGGDPVRNRAPGDADGDELSRGNDAVLPLGEGDDPSP